MVQNSHLLQRLNHNNSIASNEVNNMKVLQDCNRNRLERHKPRSVYPTKY
jgi:hypothetical protein